MNIKKKPMKWCIWWHQNEEGGGGAIVVDILHQSPDYLGAPYVTFDSIEVEFKKKPDVIEKHPRARAAQQRLLKRLARNYAHLCGLAFGKKSL